MSRRGFTLAECLIGATISGVLLAATCALLAAGHRAALALAAGLDARSNAEAASSVLAGELRVLAMGELIALTDSSVTIRALRGTGSICSVDVPASAILFATDSWSGLRAVDPLRDSVRILAELDPDRQDDDTWLLAGITAQGAAACGGMGAFRLGLSGVSTAALDSVGPGAPVRVFEVVEYRRYTDGAGERWLGVRGPSPPGWSASSPVAGPLNPVAGLVLTRDTVGLLEAQVRVRGRMVRRAWGSAPSRDSARVAMSAPAP